MQTTIKKTKTVVSPELTCVITGKARPSNEKYLRDKAESKGVTIEMLTDHYASKHAVKLLRAGTSVEDVRKQLGSEISTPISDNKVKDILRLNGKSKN